MADQPSQFEATPDRAPGVPAGTEPVFYDTSDETLVLTDGTSLDLGGSGGGTIVFTGDADATIEAGSYSPGTIIVQTDDGTTAGNITGIWFEPSS